MGAFIDGQASFHQCKDENYCSSGNPSKCLPMYSKHLSRKRATNTFWHSWSSSLTRADFFFI